MKNYHLQNKLLAKMLVICRQVKKGRNGITNGPSLCCFSFFFHFAALKIKLHLFTIEMEGKFAFDWLREGGELHAVMNNEKFEFSL